MWPRRLAAPGAGRRVPEPDDAVGARRGHLPAVGAEGHGGGPVVVEGDGAAATAGRDLPDFQDSLPGSQEAAAIRRPSGLNARPRGDGQPGPQHAGRLARQPRRPIRRHLPERDRPGLVRAVAGPRRPAVPEGSTATARCRASAGSRARGRSSASQSVHSPGPASSRLCSLAAVTSRSAVRAERQAADRPAVAAQRQAIEVAEPPAVGPLPGPQRRRAVLQQEPRPGRRCSRATRRRPG